MSTFRRIAVSAAATSFAAGMLLTAALAPSATAGPKTAVEQAGNASQATVTIGERAVDPAPLWRWARVTSTQSPCGVKRLLSTLIA